LSPTPKQRKFLGLGIQKKNKQNGQNQTIKKVDYKLMFCNKKSA